jgi:hypothetical protein
MGKVEATNENWTGLKFANNWEILKKFSCAEYKAIYEQETGDLTKKIKNAHYLCYNANCDTYTYLERTVIQRAMSNNTSCLSKCKGCNGERKGECHYSVLCRNKPLYKVPDREAKIAIGDVVGTWEVLSIVSSGNSTNHQMKATCKCTLCGETKELDVAQVVGQNGRCECFREHSSGEMAVKTYLDNNNIQYKSEYVFDNLVGLKGGSLRYDFALLDDNNKVYKLIEFDGEQHYEEAGSYFNEDGHVQTHDEIKNQFALKNNIPLLRIPFYKIREVPNLIAEFLK